MIKVYRFRKESSISGEYSKNIPIDDFILRSDFDRAISLLRNIVKEQSIPDFEASVQTARAWMKTEQFLEECK